MAIAWQQAARHAMSKSTELMLRAFACHGAVAVVRLN
jgi:hypothetical protein